MKHNTIDDIPVFLPFVIVDEETGNILHDYRKDGGDVPPLLCIAPVVDVGNIDGIQFIFISTKIDITERK